MVEGNPVSKRPVEAWADVGGLHMRYLDWGGHGQPIVALHGLASSAHWYDIVAPLLCDQYRIIAPDQRATAKPPKLPLATTGRPCLVT